jgi:CBS domain-containing protein
MDNTDCHARRSGAQDARCNTGCLPVGAADSFIGMLTEKDLTARATAGGLNPTTTTVLQIVTHGVAHCRHRIR